MEIINPKDEAHWKSLRALDITSTEIGALFGISPWTTAFELWHRKKEKTVTDISANERMKWGTRLQDSIAAGIAEDNGWKIRRMDEYIRLPELGLGASFDFSIETPGSEVGLLEVKNVDAMQAKDKWLVEDNNVEAPPHIELQVQQQLLVSGRKFAYIGALVGGNKVILIRREPDQVIHDAIKAQAKAFWNSIEKNIPPKPDFFRDADFISKLYGYAEPGKLYDAREDSELDALMEKYEDISAKEKQFREEKDALKAQVLMKIGDHEKVKGGSYTISAGIVGPVVVPEHTRAGHRMFRAYFKREKK